MQGRKIKPIKRTKSKEVDFLSRRLPEATAFKQRPGQRWRGDHGNI